MGRLGESQPSRGPDRLTHGTVHAMLSPATADMRCGSAEPATRRMTAREDRAILEHGVSAFGDTRRLGRASLAPPALAPAGRSRRPTSANPRSRSAGEHGKRHASRSVASSPRRASNARAGAMLVRSNVDTWEHLGRTPVCVSSSRKRRFACSTGLPGWRRGHCVRSRVTCAVSRRCPICPGAALLSIPPAGNRRLARTPFRGCALSQAFLCHAWMTPLSRV